MSTITAIQTSRPTIQHERLEVYDLAIDFLATVHEALANLPRNRSGYEIGEQLQRAGMSIAVDIAEGSIEFQAKEKIRYYRDAVRGAARCAAILDILANLQAIDKSTAADGKAKLETITSKLYALIGSQKRRAATKA